MTRVWRLSASASDRVNGVVSIWSGRTLVARFLVPRTARMLHDFTPYLVLPTRPRLTTRGGASARLDVDEGEWISVVKKGEPWWEW